MLDLLMKRRSTRKYTNEIIDKVSKDKLIKAALLAPTSRNRKPLEYVIVEDKSTILKLAECKKFGSTALLTSPLAIVVLGDTSKSEAWVEDASIACTFIQLEAESLGLGSCWIQMRHILPEMPNFEAGVKELLNIPSNYSVQAIIAIGHKDEDLKPYEETDLDFSKVHLEQF